MERKRYFCNPVPFTDGQRHTNPDPFVLRWCGRYYCYATDEDGIKVSRSEDLVNWEYLGYAIKEEKYRDYWAPSVFYENGTFYMYYSNLEREETDGHKEWLKLAVSSNPEGPFVYQKTFFHKFSIDSHPVMWNGKRYLFYSVNDWIGTDEKVAGTIIMVDEMITPYELAGKERPVLLPSLKQEIFAENRFGDGRDWYTLEGAATVIHGDLCYLTYSANAYVNVDYFVGTAVADICNDFLSMEWKKYPSERVWYPLLKKNERVEGTGHNTITKAPDLLEDWIIYHGRMADEELIQGKEQREMRIDRLAFNGEQLVCNGPTQEKMEAPGNPTAAIREITTDQEWKFTECGCFYLAELWISAELNHTGCRFDIYLSGTDEENYVRLEFSSGKRELCIVECQNGLQEVAEKQRLASDYDYTVPHLLSVQRMGRHLRVLLDEKYLLEYKISGESRKENSIRIIPHFTEITVHSFVLTESMILEGEGLEYLTQNYRFEQPAVLEEKRIYGKNHTLIMNQLLTEKNYEEEIQLLPGKGENSVSIFLGDQEYRIMKNVDRRYAIYCCRTGNQVQLFVNGKALKKHMIQEGQAVKILLHNTEILQYRFTKK